MSRRRRAKVRSILPDPKFSSVLVSKFINCMMYDGIRSISEKIFYKVLENLKAKTKAESLAAFEACINNVRPELEVRARRVGGATYQVPVEVRESRSFALAIRWILIAARKRSEKTMEERLTGELVDAFNNRGIAVKKCEDTHKMADANKAFSHFRW